MMLDARVTTAPDGRRFLQLDADGKGVDILLPTKPDSIAAAIDVLAKALA